MYSDSLDTVIIVISHNYTLAITTIDASSQDIVVGKFVAVAAKGHRQIVKLLAALYYRFACKSIKVWA